MALEAKANRFYKDTDVCFMFLVGVATAQSSVTSTRDFVQRN